SDANHALTLPGLDRWVGRGFNAGTIRDLVPPGDVLPTRAVRSAGGGVVVTDFRIRDATPADLPAIVDVYNQSIPAGWSTADTQPVAVADRAEWFRKFDPAKRPIWVAEAEDGRVIATAYLSSFYGGRPAYDATAEVSTYVATSHHRRGVGRRLKEFVIGQCP